jgi:hypothetical protein
MQDFTKEELDLIDDALGTEINELYGDDKVELLVQEKKLKILREKVRKYMCEMK